MDKEMVRAVRRPDREARRDRGATARHAGWSYYSS
jgi:hypothetical protein